MKKVIQKMYFCIFCRIRDSATMIEECIFRTLISDNVCLCVCVCCVFICGSFLFFVQVRTADVQGQHKTSEFVDALIVEIKEQMRIKHLAVKKA
jgi:hypothetical protein